MSDRIETEDDEWMNAPMGPYQETDYQKENRRLLARIEALILAGDGLGAHALHSAACLHQAIVSKAAPMCICGATNALAAWEKAKE